MSKQYKILHLVHASEYAELAARELKVNNISFDHIVIDTEADYRKALKTYSPDTILCDHVLPASNSFEAFRIIKENKLNVPFIIITTTLTEEIAMSMVRQGVDDYILKDRMKRLPHAVLNAIEKYRHEKEPKKLVDRVYQDEAVSKELLGQLSRKVLLATKSGGIAIWEYIFSDNRFNADDITLQQYALTQKQFNGNYNSLIKFVHPDDKQKVIRTFIEAVAQHTEVDVEFRVIWEDSTLHHIKASATIQYDVSGKPQRILGTHQDISAAKNSEKELKESEEKYRSMIESSIDGILLTAKDGSILSANAAACEMFKATEEELCQLGREGVVDMTDSRLKPLLEERNKTGRAKGELTLKRTDGTTFSGEVSSVVFIDTNGRERTSMTIRDLTSVKQAEENLISSSQQLEKALNLLNSIMDSSLDVICAVDEKGMFVSVSAASEKVWGYKPHELMGKPVFDFVYHEDHEKTKNSIENVMAGKNNIHFENRYVHKNGTLVPTSWTATWNPNDKMRYGVARDVTEIKRAEKIIEIERQRFNELYLQAPSCMGILKGPNHVYEAANPLYLQLIDKKDIIGKTVKEVLPELETQGVFDFLDSVYSTGETFSASEMLVQFDLNGNGELVDKYLNFIYQAHRNNEGTIDGILFFAIDVTEQVLSRKKIEESELRYRSLIEQATNAICIADPTMKFIEVNTYACQLFGYSNEEWLELSITDILIKEDLIENPLKTLELQSGQSVHNERRVKRKDGTLLHMELSTKSDPFGNMIIFGHDITERKLGELKLKESNAKYKAIIDNTINAFLLSDTLGNILEVNETTCKILGYTEADLLKLNRKDIFELETPEYQKAVETRKAKGIASGEVYGIKKSGERVPIAFTTSLFYTAEGEERISSIGVDITDKKIAEAALIESENYLRTIIEAEPECVKLLDKNGLLQEMNPAGLAMIEADNLAQVKGYPVLDIINEPYKAAFERLTKDGFNGISGTLQFEITGLKGTNRWLETNSVPLRNGEAEIISLLSVTRDITERKKSEEKLIKSHERFSNISKATFDVIWDWDIKSRQLYLGEAFKELFGYEINEGENFYSWSSHIHPDDKERVITNRLNKIINQDESNWKDDYRYIKSDGSIAYISDRGILLRNELGAYRMIGAMQDVTDVNRLEELLKKANALSRTGSWEVDLINNSAYWSQVIKEIHEVPDDYVPVFTTAINFIKEGPGRDIIIKKIQNSIDHGVAWQEEVQLITAKGKEIWISASGDAEFLNGQCIRIYGSFQDIDESKRAKLAIINTLEEKNTILESIGDSFFAVDSNWIVTYWNNQAEKMLGKTKNEIISRNLWEIFPESIESKSYYKYYEAIKTNQVMHFEDYYATMNKWYEISAYPLHNGLSVYFKDISERKLSDIRLNELNENLKKQSQLLAASNEELERFAYVTSHDLQEPLRMVTSFLQLLQKKYENHLDDTAQKYINFAVDGAERMKILILDLLEFSRISSLVVEHDVINVNEVVIKTQQALKAVIDESDALIKVDLLPNVCGNQFQLMQLFQNLISNAIKYKGGTRPIVQISFIENEDEWEFTIKDNGIGIDEKYFEKIFIIFQRLHNRKEYEGTGIGLAICKKIVELHGGRIWVESSTEGSQFHFTILKKQPSNDHAKIICPDIILNHTPKTTI